ncbi:hypothetical protein [Bradyrhizobium sp. CCBAU 51745]|uniref:hypothetical protein n=1 Tax=Bradyrhizobium sp. CCBAU 51745 TaxID=1325099 RepID=UPI0023053F91|nr:hypothetical protein [Bradyrhizobium sp. CCBAU 51745]
MRYGRISLIRHRFELESPRGEGGNQYRHRVQMAHGPWPHAAGAEIRNPSMLPGFRFLLAAILLSTSILVFGLGAAALVRASHEQYVSNPSWRNGPQEQMFAQASEPAQPVLAALRIEPAAPVANDAAPAMPAQVSSSQVSSNQVSSNQVPSIGLPAVETGPEQMAAVTLDAKVQPEPQVVAVAAVAEPAASATEAQAPEPARSEAAASAPTDTLTPADTTASIAMTIPAPAMSATDVPRTATPALASRVSDIAAARVAALNDLAPPAEPKANSAKQDSKPRAYKPKKRHRIVRRAPPQQVNQALDPFGQQRQLQQLQQQQQLQQLQQQQLQQRQQQMLATASTRPRQ